MFVRRRLRKKHRRFGVFLCRRTHTLFEYPLGKLLAAKHFATESVAHKTRQQKVLERVQAARHGNAEFVMSKRFLFEMWLT